MICPECGAQIPPDSRFCARCGAEVQAQDAPQQPIPYTIPAAERQGSTGVIVGVAACMAILVIAVVLFMGRLRHDDAVSANAGAKATVTNGAEESATGGAEAPAVLDSGVVGNLVNGGHMAGDGTYLYYAQPLSGTDWDTQSIVRCDPDGSNKQTIYTAPSSTVNVYHLNAVDGGLVFNQVIEGGSTVMVVDAQTGSPRTLDSCDDWSLCQVDGGFVYYLKSGRIWRCDLAGQNKEGLANVGANTMWRVYGNRLYTFPKSGAQQISVSGLDGSNASELYRESDGYTVENAFPVNVGADAPSVVVLEKANGMDDFVRIVSADGKERNLSSGGSIERVCAYDEGVLITRKDGDSYSISALGFAGSTALPDTEVPFAGQVRFTCYVNGKVLFGTIDGGACAVRSLDLSTGSFDTVS